MPKIFLLLLSLLLPLCESGLAAPAISPAEFAALAPKDSYSKTSVEELEQLKQKATTPIEQGVADLLILAHCLELGSPHPIEEVRTRLQAVADKHPGTWIAISAKTGLLETYSSMSHTNARLAILNGLLHDPGLRELENPSDPYLAEFMKRRDGPEIAKSPQDFIRSRLLYEYTTGYDLVSAQEIAEQITEPHWQEFATSHLTQLRRVPPDVRAKRREAFLKSQQAD